MKGISLGINELMLGSVKSDGFHKDGTIGFFQRMNDLMEYQKATFKLPALAFTYRL